MMRAPKKYDTRRYRFHLFARTVFRSPGGFVKEQPTWKIRLSRINSFLRSKLPAIRDVLVGYLLFATIPIILFAIAYVRVASQPFLASWWDSFLLFSNLSTPEFVNTVIKGGTEFDLTLPSYFTHAEAIIGRIADAVFLGAMTTAMLHPINRLWMPGRFTYHAHESVKESDENQDLSSYEKDRLEFSYWLRLTESEWYHHFVATLRVQSDEADRSLLSTDEETFPSFVYREDRIMRRGTSFLRVPLCTEQVVEVAEILRQGTPTFSESLPAVNLAS